MTRHFLTLRDLTGQELNQILKRAATLKQELERGERVEFMRGKTLAMIFTKSSTRTRTSFEAAVTQAGGNTLFLGVADSQLNRGEPISDTARVMSRMVDAIVIRTDAHQQVMEFGKFSRVPVINGLTDDYHPCQLLADIQTFQQHRGTIQDARVAWVGDGNNVCHSWINAADLLGFTLSVATPPGFEPDATIREAANGRVEIHRDAAAAVRGADLVVTDTWTNMGQEQEKAARQKQFDGFQVDAALMQLASPDALFMHCLPAYRGYEVSAEVIDGPQSVVWDEAENRLHAQKALLEFLL